MWALRAGRGEGCDLEDLPAFEVLSVENSSRWEAALAHVASARAAVSAMQRHIPELRDCVSEAVAKFDSACDGQSESLDRPLSRWMVAWPAERKPNLTSKIRRGRESDADLACRLSSKRFPTSGRLRPVGRTRPRPSRGPWRSTTPSPFWENPGPCWPSRGCFKRSSYRRPGRVGSRAV